MRAQPYSQHPNRGPRTTDNYNQRSAEELTSAAAFSAPVQSGSTDGLVCVSQPHTSTSQRASSVDNSPRPRSQQQHQHHQPVITEAIRARITAALTSLKGKRGAPFSFVTSGDSSSFSTRGDPINPTSHCAPRQQSFEQSQTAPLSLKLSLLLRPLKIGPHHKASDDDQPTTGVVKMPTYLGSMTLGQTITDPIYGGMISLQVSKLLYEHFMVQMNAKWEYILDPHIDTHDSVQRRSSLLFASILFCSSKFANCIDGRLVSSSDPFLQIRLCSLARNLVIKALAAGDRSIETMQALYLLVCWKDPDDDVSYLHSGYAFGILRDLDLESSDGDDRQIARCRRTWLALFRQDRQQSLFFVRKASLRHGDEDISFLTDVDTWLKMPYALPSDFVACCSADVRHIQSKLRTLVQKASPVMLPCLIELMDAELSAWRSKWKSHLSGEGRTHSNDDPSLDPELLHPSGHHLAALVGLWEQSMRLNVASAVLRQSIMASVPSAQRSNRETARASLGIDLTTIQQILSPSLPGLSSSVEGAFGTLHNFIKFPPNDLRRAPDAILLLAPNAALFLCLLLCLPRLGILGPTFQRTAVDLIRDIAKHLKQCVQSPQDTVALHSAYLYSLVELLHPSTSEDSTGQDTRPRPTVSTPHMQAGMSEFDVDDPTLQAAQVLADGIGGHNNYGMFQADDSLPSLPDDSGQNLHTQSLANLLDGDLFWEMLPDAGNIGA